MHVYFYFDNKLTSVAQWDYMSLTEGLVHVSVQRRDSKRLFCWLFGESC